MLGCALLELLSANVCINASQHDRWGKLMADPEYANDVAAWKALNAAEPPGEGISSHGDGREYLPTELLRAIVDVGIPFAENETSQPIAKRVGVDNVQIVLHWCIVSSRSAVHGVRIARHLRA